MYADYAGGIVKQNWSKEVREDARWYNDLSLDVQDMAQLLRSAGLQLNLRHNRRPKNPTTVPGIDLLAQEVYGVLGKEQPLTHRGRLTIDATLPDGATGAALTIRASNKKPDGAQPRAIEILGGLGLGGGSSLKTATADEDWVAGTGNDGTVSAVDDDSSEAVTIQLKGCPGMCPNVRDGQTVIYSTTEGGTHYAVAGYLDDAIGTIKFIDATANIPAGWQVADGTNSTPDLTGRFLKGHDTSTGTTASAGNTGDATTGISVDSHTGQTTGSSNASLSVDTNITNASAYADSATFDQNADGVQDMAATLVYFDDPGHAHSLTDNGHDHTIPTLSHSVTDGGHHHTAGEPASVTVIPIIRVD